MTLELVSPVLRGAAGLGEVARVLRALAGLGVLRANGSMGRMTIDVPCGEVLFEIREPDCLVLNVREADGTLATAGFQTGDKIIGIDGKEFEELSDITAGFFGAMGKDVTLTVLRGSTKMDLALKLPNAQGMNDMGGNFEPGNRD